MRIGNSSKVSCVTIFGLNIRIILNCWSCWYSCVLQTAVMPIEEEELHLVAMPSRNYEQSSCFWGFIIMPGLYNSCLVMLNLRCLGIVFDLDETLIVANTMRSFEDRIDALQRKINSEVDPLRIAGMLAEVKRYQDDKTILKQYAENDQVVENGKVIKVQSEIVSPLSDNHQPIVRPLIRLQEKNIILTRINPGVRICLLLTSLYVQVLMPSISCPDHGLMDTSFHFLICLL